MRQPPVFRACTSTATTRFAHFRWEASGGGACSEPSRMGVSPATIQGIAAGTAASTENGLTADNPDFGQNKQDFQNSDFVKLCKSCPEPLAFAKPTA